MGSLLTSEFLSKQHFSSESSKSIIRLIYFSSLLYFTFLHLRIGGCRRHPTTSPLPIYVVEKTARIKTHIDEYKKLHFKASFVLTSIMFSVFCFFFSFLKLEITKKKKRRNHKNILTNNIINKIGESGRSFTRSTTKKNLSVFK